MANSCKKGHQGQRGDGFSKNTHIIINQHARSEGSDSKLRGKVEKQEEGQHLISISIERGCFNLCLTSNLRQK